MKKQYSIVALSLALVAGSAVAAKAPADPGTPKGKQQAKMSLCNKEAKSQALKGVERRQFMSSCLKAKAKA